MSKFVENVTFYLTQKKIKQTYVSQKTGIDTKKLSRILTGAQDINSTDMEKIAGSLGKSMDYFLTESFSVPETDEPVSENIVFYAGNPSEKQNEFAGKLVGLMENIDEILSAKQRFLNLTEE